MTDQFNLKHDGPEEVRSLFQSAKKRREDMIKYKLFGELLAGKTVNVTQSPQLYEALNRERMEFEQLLKLHPEQVNDLIEYVKERKLEQDGVWYNLKSKANWGEKGVIPPCCYHARPAAYWKDKRLVHNFLNTFTKFRISEKPL